MAVLLRNDESGSLSPVVSAGIKYDGVVEMSPLTWIGVPDNPRQRDTEARAKKARHLRKPHETHRIVNMAVLPDGTKIKLDGHTRAYMWRHALVEKPSFVTVNVWRCGTLDDVRELYSTFDSKDAVESASDQMFGGMKDASLTLESPLLKGGRFTAAMRCATDLVYGKESRRMSIYDQLAAWNDELKLLDECRPTSIRFNTGVTAGALISFARYRHRVSDFWKGYAMNAGTKQEDEMDAVQALSERIAMFSKQRQLAGSGNYYRIVGVCLSAIDADLRGIGYSPRGGVRALQKAALKRWFDATRDAKFERTR